jgi:hypothetical protein
MHGVKAAVGTLHGFAPSLNFAARSSSDGFGMVADVCNSLLATNNLICGLNGIPVFYTSAKQKINTERIFSIVFRIAREEIESKWST